MFLEDLVVILVVTRLLFVKFVSYRVMQLTSVKIVSIMTLFLGKLEAIKVASDPELVSLLVKILKEIQITVAEDTI